LLVQRRRRPSHPPWKVDKMGFTPIVLPSVHSINP
jgi:hypothetical protein